jgi:hypothetical protein
MNESGMAVSEDDVRSLLDTLADALFTQESTRYQNGIAYSLRLAPDHLHRAILILQSSVIGRGLKLNMDSVDFSEQQPVNLHIRVNTNTNGELVFLKWYVATEAEEISLVTQGKSQWQDHPVHVEIPKDTMGFEEFFQDVGMGDRRLDQWMMPLMDTNLWKSPIKEEDWSNASEEVVHPYRAVTPRLRQMEAPRLREGCTATPGTAYYLQLARKGVCELPSRSTYRVNDTTP